MKKIEYYFDCSSPWTYLSFRGILELKKIKNLKLFGSPFWLGEFLIQQILASMKLEKIQLKKNWNILKKTWPIGQN